MNIDLVLQEGIKKLSCNKNISVPDLDAEILLSKTIKKSREYIFSHPEIKLSNYQKIKYFEFIKKRVKNIPISYITGKKEFYGLEFFVNKYTLIPRPETEMFVDHIIHNTKLIACNTTFLDIGTGTGCIPISIFKELEKNLRFKNFDLRFFATDISKAALLVAKKNAKNHGVEGRIKFFHGNLLDPILESSTMNPKSNIIITANLPYLTPEQVKNSPTIQAEPKLALIAGNDGLKYYRKLFKQINELLQNTNNELCILCEIDSSQKNSISELIKKELPKAVFEIKKDLSGLHRMAVINLK